MALDIIPKQEGGKLKAVASGTLPSGQPVVVNADGTVSVVVETPVSQSVGTPVNFLSSTARPKGAYDVNAQKVVLVYNDPNNSNYGTAVVGTVSGTSISFGTAVVFESNTTSNFGIVYDPDAGKVVTSYQASSNGLSRVGTVSGTSISFGSSATFESAVSAYMEMTYDTGSDKVIIAYQDSGNSNYGTAVVGTVSGTSISFGSPTVFYTDQSYDHSVVYDATNDKVVIAFREFTPNLYGRAIVGTVSGTSISFGSSVVFSSNLRADYIGAVYDSNSSKVVISYKETGGSGHGKSIVGTVSGTSISFGTAATFNAATTNYIRSAFNSSAGKVAISYADNGNFDYGTAISGTVSGTSISFESEVVFEAATILDPGNDFYDPTSNQVIFLYRDDVASGQNTYVLFTQSETVTNLTSENYIGMSGGVVNSTPEELGTAVVFEAASTSFMGTAYDSSAGKVVIAYRDEGNSNYGTAIVGTVSGTGISFGSPVVFNTGNTIVYENGVTFDSSSNKIVITYSDNGNSGYGTAIVGTVSGTSISFGTEAVFESAGVGKPSAVFDSNNNKVVVVYDDGGNFDYGTAVVGTVSGTSISFGTPVVFASAAVDTPAAAYDTASQKTVVAYRDRDASDHGKALVGTVSGTSISFGSVVTFNSTSTLNLSMDYDSSAEKVVIGFGSPAESIGTAIVGTVSGTSISFGSATAFDEVGATNDISVTYNPTANRTVFFYKDGNNSNYGTYNVGTVSGTAISFGGEVVFEAATSEDMTSTYDAASGNVVVAYRDKGNSNYGTAKALQVGSTTRAEVADGDNAVVDIVGTVSTNQVGLTAGQQYYVQADGTIGETPADPSVLAGTALSSDKLIVKT